MTSAAAWAEVSFLLSGPVLIFSSADLLYVTDPESVYNVVWNWTHEEHILIEGFYSLISVNIELGWPVIIPPKQYAVLLLYMPCKKKGLWNE